MDVKMNRRSLLLGAAGAAAGTGLLSAPGIIGRAQAADPLKVGFIYVGPVGDFGWSYQHDQGRKELESAMGGAVKTSFVEKVPEGPDAERVVRQLATSGHGLIFTTSFGFMNPTERVAKAFPNIKFEHATGYKTLPNMAIYNARFYEGRAIAGTIAALTSKTGVAGYIGSVPIPEVVMGINAFTLAAQKINPAFKTKVIWVNSWFDPGKEADAAKSLIDQGADILTQHTDSPAAMQVAQERGVFAFGQASDMKSFGPKAQLTSIMDNWGPYYISRAKAVLNKTWKTGSVWYGLKEGLVQMAEYGPGVSPAAKEAAEKVKAGIIAGTMHPFAGPIKDQKGVQKVAAGAKVSDADLEKMDWYVQGVQA